MMDLVFKGGVVLSEIGSDEDKFRTFSSDLVDSGEEVNRF